MVEAIIVAVLAVAAGLLLVGVMLTALNNETAEASEPAKPVETAEDQQEVEWPADDGKVAYNAYRNHTGGVSLVSGRPIPEWELLPEATRRAWAAAEDAVCCELRDRLKQLMDESGQAKPREAQRAAVPGVKLVNLLCDAFGIDDPMVRAITIYAEVDAVAVVEIHRIAATGDADRAVTMMSRRYRLIE